MDTMLQILVILATIMLSGLGVMSMLAPHKMLSNFALQPSGNAGLNTIRSVIGGLFIACASALILGLTQGLVAGYLLVALVMAAVAFGRVLGLAIDGFEKAVLPPLILELAIIAVLGFGYLSATSAV
ncbi:MULTISPECIES: DUF4345 family protein [Aliagarivorans]|uniref:DUF4345 family protein n=1 Tax=Aliagarivorans TaxID=882379 RepID=UPI0004229980|nr:MULTISPECIES: DUF4345 family protein [Aliagarivorans]